MDSNGAGHEAATIGELQDRLGRALKRLSELIARGRIPADLAKDLDPLRQLAPEPGYSAHVALHRADKGPDPSKLGRDIPDHAGAHYWQPASGNVVRIWYEPASDSQCEPSSQPVEKGLAVRETPAASREFRRVSTNLVAPVRDLVRELDRAERSGKPYVVLTWFRDTWLTLAQVPWAGLKDDASARAVRQHVLSEAIDCGCVATGKASNPNVPGQESATVRLERGHPEVIDALATDDPLPRFRPVPIRGEPLSQTVIRERR